MFRPPQAPSSAACPPPHLGFKLPPWPQLHLHLLPPASPGHFCPMAPELLKVSMSQTEFSPAHDWLLPIKPLSWRRPPPGGFLNLKAWPLSQSMIPPLGVPHCPPLFHSLLSLSLFTNWCPLFTNAHKAGTVTHGDMEVNGGRYRWEGRNRSLSWGQTRAPKRPEHRLYSGSKIPVKRWGRLMLQSLPSIPQGTLCFLPWPWLLPLPPCSLLGDAHLLTHSFIHWSQIWC